MSQIKVSGWKLNRYGPAIRVSWHYSKSLMTTILAQNAHFKARSLLFSELSYELRYSLCPTAPIVWSIQKLYSNTLISDVHDAIISGADLGFLVSD